MDKERKGTIQTMVENYYTQVSVIQEQPDLNLEEYLKKLGLQKDEIKFGLRVEEEIACSGK